MLFLNACAGLPDAEKAPLRLKSTSYAALPGWETENFLRFFAAYEKSCERILKNDPGRTFGPDGRWGTYDDWQQPCRAARSAPPKNAQEWHAFLKVWYKPYKTFSGSDPVGLFTGYFEPSLNGAKRRHGAYQYPLYKRPGDLIMVNLGEFRDDLKGRRIAGRINKSGYLKPFESREQITDGRWQGGEVLVWVDSPVDKFFLQIQGSGVVRMQDGQIMRVGYDGQNGHPYFAIGRELVQRGVLEKKDVSLQTIRAWLEANPDQAQEMMNLNASYVFFRKIEGDGPLGAEGTVLTPSRSLAVDRAHIPYGALLWLEAEPPAPDTSAKLQRLMVAQDTGGAIRGAVRGDVFWGYGAQARHFAGHMKSKGRYWALLPKTITITPGSSSDTGQRKL